MDSNMFPLSESLQIDSSVISIEVGEIYSVFAYTKVQNGIRYLQLQRKAKHDFEKSLIDIISDMRKDADLVDKSTDIKIVCCGSLETQIMENLAKVSKKIIRRKKSQALGKAVHYMLSNLDEENSLYPYTDPDVVKPGMKALIGVNITQPKKESKKNQTFPAIVCSVGDSIEYYKVESNGSCKFIERTPCGAVYLLGLSKLLTEAKSLDDVKEQSKKGDSSNLTTALTEIILDTYGVLDPTNIMLNFPFTIDVYPFGKVIRNGITKPSREDKSKALVLVNYGHITMGCSRQAKIHDVEKVYFTGSLFEENEVLSEYLNRLPYTGMLSGNRPCYVRVLKYECFLGVIGGFLLEIE